MDEFNPYKPPEAPRSDLLVPEPDEGRGVWSDGPALVMSKYARLPSRCVKCDAPASARIKRSLLWHPRAIYFVLLLFPVGLLIYLVLFLIYRKMAMIEVPLCTRHLTSRRVVIVIAWIAAIIGVATDLSPLWTGEDFENLTELGGVLPILAIFFGVRGSRMVRALKINKNNIWLRGVGPDYLASLDPLPRPEAEL